MVFFHSAYGNAAGELMTTSTPAQVGSVSKLITGVLVLLYADRALIDLDVPIEQYLPALKGAQPIAPISMRKLLTHTSGLRGHVGDEHHDLEERVADILPYLRSPVTHVYNGRGFALAVKALEMISGEPLPVLYRRLLFEPLGMQNSDLLNSHSAVITTAWDLALVGQLLLNSGVHENLRLFDSETLQRAKPRRLTSILGAGTQQAWGVGFWGSREEERWGFVSPAFGHNSFNSSLLRVDPSTGLVVAISSAEDGSFLDDALRGEMLATLASGLDENWRWGTEWKEDGKAAR